MFSSTITSSLPTPTVVEASVGQLFGTKKLEWWKNSDAMFIHFDTIHERDGHTHTDRQTPHDSIGPTYA